jgi:hypothetical protein
MENEFEHVNGQALFCGEAVETIMDYQRRSMEDLESKEIENAIITRLSKSALAHLAPDISFEEIQKVVSLAYMAHRPATQKTKTLFFRVTHIRSLVFTVVDAVVPLSKKKGGKKSTGGRKAANAGAGDKKNADNKAGAATGDDKTGGAGTPAGPPDPGGEGAAGVGDFLDK